MHTHAIVHLVHGDSVALVCPAIGGALAALRWRGIDILRPASDEAIKSGLVRQMACYPLVPYSNRIGDAQLQAEGQHYTLRANFPPEPHSIHGMGWQRAWTVEEQEANRVVLSLQHQPDADWPFACTARQTITLDAQGLHMALSITNRDTRAMPAGLGFHPYFPLTPGVRLQAHWSGVWRMGADQLPCGSAPEAQAAPFAQPQLVAGWRSDHCYSGWDGVATLSYAQHAVRLTASEDCRQLVCFAPGDERAFIALEPVSNVNNAFALAARGVAYTGMRLLAPQQSMEISASIGVGESVHA